MYLHLLMYAYMYACLSVCVCMHACMHVFMYIGCICMHASMRVFGKYVTCFTPSYLRVFRATPAVNIQITIPMHICSKRRKA